MALSKSMADELSGKGRIRATARLPEIDAYIRKLNETYRPLSPTEMQVLTIEGSAQIRVIKLNWPVQTGTSRAGWSYYINPSPGQIAIIFENPVYYSGWIVLKGNHSVAAGGTPWYQVLLPQVWKAGKPRLLRKLKEEIDKTQKEIAHLMERGMPKRLAEQQAGTGRISTPAITAARAVRESTQEERLQAAIRRLL